MPQTITLEIPEGFYKPLLRNAEATKQPIEQILLNALQTSLPSLEGLPNDFIENLTSLENLGDEQLRQVLNEKVPTKTQKKISDLLKENKTSMTAVNKTLENLQREADLVMLRKARAAVLLRFRGQSFPSLAEFEQTR